MWRWIGLGLIVLGLAAGTAYWWLALESGEPDRTYTIDIVAVRRLAESLPSDKVDSIRVEHVASFSYPGNIVLAGDGWSPVPLEVFAYKVMFASGGSALIDTGLTPRGAQEMGMEIDRQSVQRERGAIKFASLILVTHEHGDHIGGLLAFPFLHAEMQSGRVKLNPEQLANLGRYNPEYDRPSFVGYEPFRYDKYRAVAPGIVLIRAPGHTPGSQMVFVRRADGQEFLFTGDVAWTMRNIDAVRERARFATWLLLGEDRQAVLAELAALHALHEAEPNIHIVPGHDIGVVDGLERSGLLVSGFR
ncbi:MAG TPA: MBL fold metallo-hydrolase [Rhizomicrobium sp.]|nr:MBL fold metallo-hydrolase [Rhizomicrobium sp.]